MRLNVKSSCIQIEKDIQANELHSSIDKSKLYHGLFTFSFLLLVVLQELSPFPYEQLETCYFLQLSILSPREWCKKETSTEVLDVENYQINIIHEKKADLSVETDIVTQI